MHKNIREKIAEIWVLMLFALAIAGPIFIYYYREYSFLSQKESVLEIDGCSSNLPYHITLSSLKYNIRGGSNYIYLYSSNNKKIAKLSLMNTKSGNEYLSLLKESNNISFLDKGQNKNKTATYSFYKKISKTSVSYNYILFNAFGTMVIESVVPEKETKKIISNISIQGKAAGGRFCHAIDSGKRYSYDRSKHLGSEAEWEKILLQ